MDKKDNVVLWSQSSDIEINSYQSGPDVKLSYNFPTDSIVNIEGYDLVEENKKQDYVYYIRR